jgi:hypothetical protein
MHGPSPEEPTSFGLMAEFDTAKELVEACRLSYAAGYRQQDAYSPYPIHDLDDALQHTKSRVPLLMLCGGIFGAFAGFLLQYITATQVYPLNVGGRPLNSWPAFIPITFETTILFAGLTAVIGMFLLNGLPRPHHPVFAVEGFAAASQDRFFLCIEATDPLFDRERTEAFLRSLNPNEVSEVEN